jgi:hypothetical protein
LSLVTPVSHDPCAPGERGMLPDVVAWHGDYHDHWEGHDVYVSGSVPTVRATIARLQELNIPLANIRFDAYGGMDGLWQPGAGQGAPVPPRAPGGPGTGAQRVSGPADAPQGGWRRDSGWRAGAAGPAPIPRSVEEYLSQAF